MVKQIESVLEFEITTRHQAVQAKRKIDALVLGGWEILHMQDVEVTNPQTGQIHLVRQVFILGDQIPNPEVYR